MPQSGEHVGGQLGSPGQTGGQLGSPGQIGPDGWQMFDSQSPEAQSPPLLQQMSEAQQ